MGLGNPGLRYRRTRHNVGFDVVDTVAQRHGLALGRRRFNSRLGEGPIGRERVVLLEPHTYMNLSGSAVGAAVHFYQVELASLLVVLDEFQLELGRTRLRREGSAGGHKGLASVIRALGTEEFPRLRLGTGPTPEGQDPMRFVLTRFRRDEQGTAREMIERAATAVETWVYLGIEEAMNRFNSQ